ncbi:MAG: heparan-alpha-glucosaminide N-acetyltransferase domain-containing protein [Tissierellia bacterium]|nr:heparan-alpha-glucosaminide N-acetyltransferase domain-containing protein [Tissierellia bacterium]
MRDNRLDRLRGFFIINMILYHGLYDLVYLFHWNFPLDRLWWYQQFIGMGFIAIAGFSANISRNSFIRGVKLLFWAMVLTFITSYFIPEEKIQFGVLHLLALSMLLTPVLKKGKNYSTFFFILFFFLFVVFKMELLPWKNLLPSNCISFIWGVPDKNFQSSDYYPLIPWFFLFGAGYYGKTKVKLVKKKTARDPLAFMGRHSLGIYLIHQPLLYLFFQILFH